MSTSPTTLKERVFGIGVGPLLSRKENSGFQGSLRYTPPDPYLKKSLRKWGFGWREAAGGLSVTFSKSQVSHQ